MDRLYAPWRHSYVKGSAEKPNRERPKDECVFCAKFAENQDQQNFILKRFENSIMMLNLYPYNAGHLLILPREHHADLFELSANTRAELMNVATLGTELLKKVLAPSGFNLGINLGAAAGASVPSHLHIHLLPRWRDDTNFLPLLANTKGISSDLNGVFNDLKAAIDAMDLTPYF
jgi:ATP adenylyltransferase